MTTRVTDGLPPADCDGDQHDDRERGKSQMKEKLVCLLIGRLAVVARDRDVHVVWDQTAFERVQSMQEVLSHHDRIGACPLGDGDAHRRGPAPCCFLAACVVPHAMLARARPDHHRGDVTDVDRPVVARGDQQQADVRDAGQASGRRRRCA